MSKLYEVEVAESYRYMIAVEARDRIEAKGIAEDFILVGALATRKKFEKGYGVEAHVVGILEEGE